MTTPATAAAASPLPRGPHELTRDEVTRSQRERLLLAMAEAVADRGYARTAVADVIRRAGVSRATFYEQFADKEECFRAAYEAIADLMATVLSDELSALTAVAPEERPPSLELIDHILRRYLQLLQDAPALAKTFLVEVYAAGPRAIEQRRVSLERFVDLVAEAFRGSSGFLGADPDQRFAVQALVGAVGSLVTNMIGAGDIDHLLELHGPLVRLVQQVTEAGSPAV